MASNMFDLNLSGFRQGFVLAPALFSSMFLPPASQLVMHGPWLCQLHCCVHCLSVRVHCNKFPYNHGTFFRKIPICVSVVTSSVNIRKP